MTQGPDPPAIRRRFAVQPSSIIAVSAMIFAIVSVPIRRNIHANSGELGGHAPDAASTDCSVAFTGTNRIEGRVIASQIASASAASLLLRLTKALTVAGGISLTLCPSAFSSRPNNARSRGLPYRPHTARATGNRITLLRHSRLRTTKCPFRAGAVPSTCPLQAGWPHRRARREALRHAIGGNGATRGGLRPR